MRASTPSKVEKTTHKITKIFILINLRRVKGFVSVVDNEKIKVHGGESNWKWQGGGNQWK